MKRILRQEQDKALAGIIQKIAGKAWYQKLVDETPEDVREYDGDDEELKKQKEQYDRDLKDLDSVKFSLMSDINSYKVMLTCEDELKELLK